MTLGDKQSLMGRLTGRLLTRAVLLGYEVRLGEAYRPPETAALYAQQGRGIAASLHCQKLAIDILLFRGGAYLARTEDYEPLGTWWEAQDSLCRWGGRFNDGQHFSLEHEGRK